MSYGHIPCLNVLQLIECILNEVYISTAVYILVRMYMKNKMSVYPVFSVPRVPSNWIQTCVMAIIVLSIDVFLFSFLPFFYYFITFSASVQIQGLRTDLWCS